MKTVEYMERFTAAKYLNQNYIFFVFVSAHWATVDWSWPKEWNKCVQPNLRFKKKKKEKAQVGNELSDILPKSLHARKKSAPPHFVICN